VFGLTQHGPLGKNLPQRLLRSAKNSLYPKRPSIYGVGGWGKRGFLAESKGMRVEIGWWPTYIFPNSHAPC